MENPVMLAIDCATGPLSVAVWKNGGVAAYLEDVGSNMQSARLVPMIENVLKKSNTAYADLSAVACTTGPGSFTGIRVALATARGIAFAAGVKGLGFTTLEVLAHTQKGKVLAALNAGKGECYYQMFEHGRATSEPRVGDFARAKTEANNATIVGNMDTNSALTFPRADILAVLATTGATPRALSPFYIRPPDAKPTGKIG